MTQQISGQACRDLAKELHDYAGLDVEECYQCGKCTAGCPVVDEMDVAPNMVVRLCQLGRRDKVLGSKTIWICAACQMCMTRCPQEFDIAKLMDVLRQISYREGRVHAEASGVASFYKAFLDVTRRYGRLSEVGLTGIYKLMTFPRGLFQDVSLAPAMRARKKLHVLPKGIKGASRVREIVDRCLKESHK
jgi:heterodisulfide reductase subunit C